MAKTGEELEKDKDKLVRALSSLTGLRQNVSVDSIKEYNDLTTSHVDQFHTILEAISSTGIDVSEFFIREREVEPMVAHHSAYPDTYSEEKYVRKSIFLAKLDGIINYLTKLLKEEPCKALFKNPEDNYIDTPPPLEKP
ncbi:hypothetical protein ES703_114563 [subsurface metagenome]